MYKAKDKILIFTGAGFAVPLGLPTTENFQNNYLIDYKVRDFIMSYLGERQNDIEHILATLELFCKENTLERHIIKENATKKLPGFGPVKDSFETIVKGAKESVRDIKTNIFAKLENYDLENATKLYTALLQELKAYKQNACISIFTTNYDLTFESTFTQDSADEAMEVLGIEDIDYGFTNKKSGSSVFKKDKLKNWAPSVLEYKKLHGSLDWSENKGNIIRSGTSYVPLSPEEMLLLYPGWKGTPVKEPFVTMHNQLSERLHEADLVIVIGFAFRDDYINSLFEYGLRNNKNLQILLYDPKPADKFPIESKVKYFVDTFPKQFIPLETGIDITKGELLYLGNALMSLPMI